MSDLLKKSKEMFVDEAVEVFEEEEFQKPEELEIFEGPEEQDEIDVLEDDKDIIEVEEGLVPGSDASFIQYSEDSGNDEEGKEQKPESENFIDYIKIKLTKIPRHSGNHIPGCERAISYLKALENEATKAMKEDFDGKINEEELDKVLKDIDGMVFRLENHIERLRKNAMSEKVNIISTAECKKCESVAPMWYDKGKDQYICMSCKNVEENGLSKKAGAATVNVYITPWERAITSSIINSVVSGGKNIKESFEYMSKKYDFTSREKLSFVQLLSDYGYPMLIDRGRVGEESTEQGEEFEWITNYNA